MNCILTFRAAFTASVCMLLFACLALLVQPAKAGFDEATAAFAASDYPKVLAELTPLAKQGDPRSQYSMGLLYENGFGVAIDPTVAATWYLKAAEQGNSDAQYNLGVMLERGVGVPVNHTEAARWYRPAAEQGDIDALNNLGVLYETGRGVPQDKILAMALYSVSVSFSDNSSARAQQNRQLLAKQMSPEDLRAALVLAGDMLKMSNLKPALQAYLKESTP